jgi:heme-degrading monooxygenase HmoA
VFSVLFEVNPHEDQWDAYPGYAKMLRPELEQVDGFIDNIRYRSLNREGWILSLSNWRDEKSLVRWRAAPAITTSRNVAAPTSSPDTGFVSGRSPPTPASPTATP